MPTFVYPTNAELRKIAPIKMATMQMNDPIFKYFPVRNVNTDTVMWEQRDSFRGLQAVRGMNGQFARVQKTGQNRFTMIPGYYGEFEEVDEMDLTRLRPLGMFGDALDATDMVLEKQEKLLSREVDRIRVILWLLASYGAFAVQDEQGAILHTDSYSPQTYTATNLWSDRTNSTPLADMRAIKLLARGKGVRFDASSELYLSQVKANDLMLNNNANDIGKKLVNNGSSVISMADVNTILAANDLPKIVVHDDGYLTEVQLTLGGVTYNPGDFVPFIANNKGVLFGNRIDGAALGEYEMTRNANNANSAPGPYDEVIESKEPPKSIKVYRGHNGGPALYYPGSEVVLNI